MKLENQVSSLELSKELKELGVKQESLFYWVKNEKENKHELYPQKLRYAQNNPEMDTWKPNWISAFTVAELGVMLPELKTTSEKKDKGYWNVYVMGDDGYRSAAGGETEADARAKMLIYLLENKLIEI